MPLVLDESWVGRRVVIRRVLTRPDDRARARSDDRPSGRVFGDITGDLLEFDDQRVRLLTRAGVVELGRDAITHAKPVPASAAAVLALEQVASDGWRAAEVSPAHGWLLRADHGFTTRANSVLALRSPAPDLASALDTAATWYAARELPLRISCPLPVRAPLDAALDGLGWPARTDVEVQTAPIDRLAANPAPERPPVLLASEPDGPWLDEYRRERAERDGAPSIDVARALLTRHHQVRFASIRVDGQVVAIARGTLDHDWLGLTAVAVHPDHRRGGLAQAMTAQLADWARRHGGTRAYLQVEATNRPAIALYAGLGFWRHHSYRLRTHPTMG
jgi:ribosomal protein S18 acetylase RimI-like enzyme